MFDVSFPELVLVAVIGLLVLGPQRLPKVVAEIGKWVGRARRTATQLRRQLEREIELSDIEPPPPPRPPQRPTAPPPSAPREGDVPDGPGTHAESPDTVAAAPAVPTPDADPQRAEQPPADEPVASPATSSDPQPADRPPP
jgi:sec-independent protein translocase protein TatB